MCTILQAQAECILLNSLTDYSGKTSLECHISIGKLTTKVRFRIYLQTS